MKNILLQLSFLITLFLLNSCGQKNQEIRYNVAGTIKSATGEKLLLQEIPYGGKPIITLDSTSLKEDGKYSFDFIAKEEGIYRIATEKDLEILFINDVENIQINADANDYNSYEIKGSKTSEGLLKFLKEYRQKDSSIFATLYNLDALQNQKGKDSTIFWLQKQKTDKISQLNQFIEKTITTETNPAFLYYALGLSIRSMEANQVLAMAKLAAEKTKASPLIDFVTTLSSQVQANTTASPIEVGQMAPEIALQDMDGKIITLSSLKGKFVLVDFWASWCGPCRGENPNVVANFEKYKNKNFTVLGVSLDDDKANWIEAIESDKLNWQHISDLKKWESIVVGAYQIEGIPFNVLLDPTGKIIAKDLRGPDLGNTLETLLK
ncbi:MAG: redoxin domain-containing protein [Chitinophagaceae bacterium]